jgi:hypothetical protein
MGFMIDGHEVELWDVEMMSQDGILFIVGYLIRDG